MEKKNRKQLGILLTVAMVVAMLMGPGPGLRLINPDSSDPGATYTLGGVPVIYVWGLFWFAVQVAVVVTAYFTVWNDRSELPQETHRGGV